MNLRFILGLLTAGWLSGQPALADVAAQNPYTPIITRNVFGLVPIPVVDPATLVPANPPPRITPNGIMTLFGKLQVLFKVAGVPKPGQPPKDESYVMCEGDRQDDIEVQKIDEPSATITFNNHGVVQELPLIVGTASGGGPPPQPPGMGPPPGTAPPAADSNPIGFGGRFGRNRNVSSGGNPGAANSGGGMPSYGAATVAPSGTAQQEVSPEEQIINMEAQRAKFLDEGNPAAAIIPPTALTSQVTGEGDAGSPPGPGSAVTPPGLGRRTLGRPPISGAPMPGQ